jgi:demethylmenaquinone methyltransferase / 2-methoxy-6-polyprenyl-1,4-benzoquinol methylase
VIKLEVDAQNVFATELFRGLPQRYDLLAELLSFGQNHRWRMELVRHIAGADPASILDVATGTAGVAMALARNTRATITGVDLSQSMLAIGRERVEKSGLESRIRLRQGRAEALPFESGQFDALSFTYLLRYVRDPQATVNELARVVRPGGVVASLDFFVPPLAAARAAWWLYTRAVLPAAGMLLGGRAWLDVGSFLGPNIESHYRRWPLARIVEAWEAAGMVQVSHSVMSLGGGVVMWGRKRA